MRIAIFSECYLPVVNGVVTSILSLRETLQNWGHNVVVFAPGSPQPDDDSDIIRLPELPFPRHPYKYARPFLHLPFDFAALDIQIIHCQHPFTVGKLGAEIARRYGLPMVYTAHTLYDTMVATAKSPLLRAIGAPAARGVVRRFCARADYVIAPSYYTRDSLAVDGVEARLVVVPSGINALKSSSGARDRLRAELKLCDETSLILFAGRLAPEKRIDLLVDSTELLAKSGAKFKVVIVGDGPSRHELQELAVELGVAKLIHFAGPYPHDEMGDWYAAADIFAMPAPLETQGLVLVEAMAAGLPCVGVEHGGVREIILSGHTGLTTEFDPVEFANALKRLVCDRNFHDQMGVGARLRARAYSPEAMTSGVLGVYEAALRLPHAPVVSQINVRNSVAALQRRTEKIERIRVRTLSKLTKKHRKYS